jgi:hypothetical protein
VGELATRVLLACDEISTGPRAELRAVKKALVQRTLRLLDEVQVGSPD